MTNQFSLYLPSAFTSIWEISHLFPTKSVVDGFGEISVDNKHNNAMEWIVEGVALIFIGLPIATVTIVDPFTPVSQMVYIITSIGLFVLAAISSFTGFKDIFVPFRLCPFVFSA